MFQKLAYGFRRTDNFVEHRRAIDFLPQNEILVPELLFHPLSVVDVGCRHVPADDLAIFVFKWAVLKELPAILPGLEQQARFHLERDAPQEPFLPLGLDAVEVVRMGAFSPHLTPGWLAGSFGLSGQGRAGEEALIG